MGENCATVSEICCDITAKRCRIVAVSCTMARFWQNQFLEVCITFNIQYLIQIDDILILLSTVLALLSAIDSNTSMSPMLLSAVDSNTSVSSNATITIIASNTGRFKKHLTQNEINLKNTCDDNVNIKYAYIDRQNSFLSITKTIL